MATTLPNLNRRIDQIFTSSWYEIRAEAIDNILDATPVTAALRGMGSFKTQTGGLFITRTVRHGTETATAVSKGDTLTMGEPELDTMARWTWRYLAVHVQRSLTDDQQNSGPSQIKSLVSARLEAAKDAISQKIESQLLGTQVTDESGKEFQGLNDVVSSNANKTTGTYGAIARSNAWWLSKYKDCTDPFSVTLLTDMKNLYNTVGLNYEVPNLILTTQTLFEAYEDYALDASQIIKDSNTRMADLGFDVLKFKGKDMIWSPNVTAGDMMMLNTKYIDVVYDPNVWFDATGWKPIYNQLERVMHIVSTLNVVSSQLRRHGLLYGAT